MPRLLIALVLLMAAALPAQAQYGYGYGYGGTQDRPSDATSPRSDGDDRTSPLHDTPQLAAEGDDTIQQLIERARAGDSTVIIIAPDRLQAAPTPTPLLGTRRSILNEPVLSVEEGVVTIRDRLVQTWNGQRAYFGRMARSIARLGGWPMLQTALLILLASFAAGSVVEWIWHRWADRQIRALTATQPHLRRQQLTALVWCAAIGALGVAIHGIVMLTAGSLLVPDAPYMDDPARLRQAAIDAVFLIAGARLLRVVVAHVLAVRQPALRTLPLSDAQARRLMRCVDIGLVVLLALYVPVTLTLAFPTHPSAVDTTYVLVILISLILSVGLALHGRRALTALVRGWPPVSPARQVVAQLAPALVVLGLIAVGVFGVIQQMLDTVQSGLIAVLPLLIGIAAPALNGIGLLIVDRLIPGTQARPALRRPTEDEAAAMATARPVRPIGHSLQSYQDLAGARSASWSSCCP